MDISALRKILKSKYLIQKSVLTFQKFDNYSIFSIHFFQIGGVVLHHVQHPTVAGLTALAGKYFKKSKQKDLTQGVFQVFNQSFNI